MQVCYTLPKQDSNKLDRRTEVKISKLKCIHMLHISLLLEKVIVSAHQGTVPIVSVGGELLTIDNFKKGFVKERLLTTYTRMSITFPRTLYDRLLCLCCNSSKQLIINYMRNSQSV